MWVWVLLFATAATGYAILQPRSCGRAAAPPRVSHRHSSAVMLAKSTTPDYDKLNTRLESKKREVESVRCMLLDTMLPRQRIEMQFGPPVSVLLSQCQASGDRIVVLGMDQKDGTILKRGVEARIESMSPYRASHGFFSSHSTRTATGFTAFDTTLVGGRRFEVIETIGTDDPYGWPPAMPVFGAKVRWLADETASDATAAAVLKAGSLKPLVDEWVELVGSGKRERTAGQLVQLLADLGPMPEAEEADDRAFWAAALINPLPALGVAREVRPAVLRATEALERVELVHSALVDSIAKMKEMPPGCFEVEPKPRGFGPR